VTVIKFEIYICVANCIEIGWFFVEICQF